jgi:hypothetical protein
MDVIKYGPLTLELDEEATKPGYCVTACEKDAVEVEIPLRVGEYNVISIGESAFEDCTELISVVFPVPEDPMERWDMDEKWLSEIGEYAFSGCTSLITVDIPDTVYTIARGAFRNCGSLVAVTFDYWTYIGPYAFSGCSSLVSISEFHYASEGILQDCTSLVSVTIGESCSEIDEDAFEHCESLRQMVIPSSVDRIEALAFRGCYALTRVTFEEPKGWYMKNCYNGAEVALDLSDPVANAHSLSWMDFDDGVIAWYRKE